MELIKNNWRKDDINDFQRYLETFKRDEKREWSTNLLKSNLPVLCMKTKDIKDIVEKIGKGNYLEFLDHMPFEYYENTAIDGFLISKIDDFSLRKKYLDIYSEKIDNWASCDLLTFNVKGNWEQYFNLTLEYINNANPFKRRIGMYVLFDFIKEGKYLDETFGLLDQFENEEAYYVNMMNAWLLCECYILHKEKTLEYLKNHKLNPFTINKAIQKCQESRRVCEEDKKILQKYKIRRK